MKRLEWKFARQKPESEVINICPALGKEMLDTSLRNRPLRGWYVDLLASVMRRGEWRVTSQGIGFDSDGHLLDAHHRLNAGIKSGVSFPSVVVFGLNANAYEVIDTGMMRTYADRLNEDRSVTDVLRLGCQYALNSTKPSIDQMKPILDAGFRDVAKALIEFCGSRKRFYASAPMKLAACITIMNGGRSDFVAEQYRALCNLDFNIMSNAAQSLVRQVDNGKLRATDTRDVLARGFRVFDESRDWVSKIQITDADIDAAGALVRSVLRRSVNQNRGEIK